MDYLALLQMRIQFLERFHGVACAPFEEKMRKINESEEPYDPNLEEDGSFRFTEEMDDAQHSVDIVRFTCLTLLAGAFQFFLYQRLDSLDSDWRSKVGKKGNWFRKVEEYCRETHGIDFAAAGVDLDFIEQVILARNDFAHPLSLWNEVRQSTEHFQKYPTPSFADDMELFIRALSPESQPSPIRLKALPEQMAAAFQDIMRLATHLSH